MQTAKGGGMQDSVENLVTLFEHGTLNRQQLIQGLLAALAPISAVANAHADTTTTATFHGRSLNHVTLSVSDVEISKKFYARLLGGTICFETEKGGASRRCKPCPPRLPHGLLQARGASRSPLLRRC